METLILYYFNPVYFTATNRGSATVLATDDIFLSCWQAVLRVSTTKLRVSISTVWGLVMAPQALFSYHAFLGISDDGFRF